MKKKQITVKLRRVTHRRLQKAQAKVIGKRGKQISFAQFCDEVIGAGLRAKRLG